MVGPYEQLKGLFPLYILQFDKRGASKSPQTTTQLLNEIRSGAYTHIYLFSHGWNNDFGDALSLYREFFNLFLDLRSRYGAPSTAPYKPVFIGLHWPSIILLLPWDKGPRIAAGAGGDAVFDSFARVRELIGEELGSATVDRFYELTAADRLNEKESRELAAILAPLYRANALDAEGGKPAEIGEDGIVAAWKSLPGDSPAPAPPDYTGHGRVKPSDSEVRAASAADFLDPRNAIRVTTVLIMKDRAGLIGRFGLAPLLANLIPAAGKIPIRLIGHSYGARVCLTALTAPELKSLQVSSVLLLQPAVNQYCFAVSVPALGVPGGFVPALKRIRAPIYSTFSDRDIPLHALFHLAARRIEDRGEIRYAAEGPSEFSALGGYGPAGMIPADTKEEEIHRPDQRYDVPSGVKVLALNGSAGEITGHGDVRTEFTCWALVDQEIANVF
jgi:pimeloyl-ACP methyl ester carboxylesterase